MRRRGLLPLPLPLLLGAHRARAEDTVPVRVVSESWAWLIHNDARGRPRGPIVDFIGRMNEVQARYRFEVRVVPRLRVNLMFERGEADVFPLRTLAWADPGLRLQATRPLLKTGDLYIARADNRHGGQAIFRRVAERHLAGVRGYHYGVFGNDPDERRIHARFKAELLPNNEAVIEFVLRGRAEVGIVPEAIMAFALRDPALRAQILLSEQYDSQVELSHLVREGGPIGVPAMNEIVERLERAGDVRRLREQLGIRR